MYQFHVGMVILSMAGLFACVESFLPTSSLPSQSANTVRYKSETISTTTILHLAIVVAAQVCRQKSRVHQKRPQHQSSSVILSGSEQDDTNNNNNANGNGNGGTGVLESVGLVSQPIVWISLYSVATTGHGLPAGPGGSIGAVEGIAYLVVVAMALLPTSVTAGGNDDDGGSSLARTLSRTSIAVGLLVLAGVAVGKGYVPNAKPILDYSAYLPVCSAE